MWLCEKPRAFVGASVGAETGCGVVLHIPALQVCRSEDSRGMGNGGWMHDAQHGWGEGCEAHVWRPRERAVYCWSGRLETALSHFLALPGARCASFLF